MYDIAKKARAGMKSKAERLAGEKDRKTDSSDWSPAPALNADVKTGMRPVSRQARKRGGKVLGKAEGEESKSRADRAPRKAGGKVETKGEQPLVDRYINRDLKKANEYRDGKKHDGGLKRGGRAKYATDGAVKDDKVDAGFRSGRKPGVEFNKPYPVPVPPRRPANMTTAVPSKPDMSKALPGDDITGPPKEVGMKRGGATKWIQKAIKKPGALHKQLGVKKGEKIPAKKLEKAAEKGGKLGQRARLAKTLRSMHKDGGKVADEKCYGGRTKKADGGPMQVDPRLGIVKPKVLEFGQNVVTPGMKKGGRIKKEIGGAARAAGMGATPSLAPVPVSTSVSNASIPTVGSGLLPPSTATYTKTPAYDPAKYGDTSSSGDKKSKFSDLEKLKGKSSPLGLWSSHDDAQAVKKGGRVAKADGGALVMGKKPKAKSAKGKTNINIIIATGKANKPEETPMAPMGAGAPPAIPPAAMMGAGAPPPPMGPAMPPMGPPPAPAGMGRPPMPPMPRKDGGRISKVAKSFKDMTAGAGSGEGRLQKTDIAKRAPHKRGGKVYRSYKDMDAGAGSGEGRLEKTEIQSRKK